MAPVQSVFHPLWSLLSPSSHFSNSILCPSPHTGVHSDLEVELFVHSQPGSITQFESQPSPFKLFWSSHFSESSIFPTNTSLSYSPLPHFKLQLDRELPSHSHPFTIFQLESHPGLGEGPTSHSSGLMVTPIH